MTNEKQKHTLHKFMSDQVKVMLKATRKEARLEAPAEVTAVKPRVCIEPLYQAVEDAAARGDECALLCRADTAEEMMENLTKWFEGRAL